MTKNKEITALQSYFTGENEHWNKYSFEMFCEVVKEGLFTDPEIPLQLINSTLIILNDNHKTPVKAIHLFFLEQDKYKLNLEQSLFIAEKAHKYIRISEFDQDLTEVKDLLQSHIERMESEQIKQKNIPLMGNIRGVLKELVQNEIKELPTLFEGLEPKQRINVLCKLIPYVLPKVETIHAQTGEPDHVDENTNNENGIFSW